MALDVELYRRTLSLPIDKQNKLLRRISVIDIHPEGATRTFVFIHGYGGNAMQWLYQLRFFGQTVRVVAPDLRGHGHSNDPSALPMSMNGLVGDVEYVLDALEVERPFALISHSFGGAVATEYALRHPEALTGLILVGVPTRFIVRPIVQRLFNVPDPVFSWTARQLRIALYAPQRTLKRMHDNVMATWRGSERFQQLHVPTLVILGHRDTVFLRQHYEDVPRSIPGAHEVVIPVSAHLVQLERPDAVNRAITRFLEPKPPAMGAQSIVSDASLSPVPTSSPGMILRALQSARRHAEMPWLQYYDSDVPEQVPYSKQLLHDMLSNAAQSFPLHPAILFFGQKIGYGELDRLSNRFAHALRALGVQVGERVAIVLPNVPQCVIAFYGTLKAGAVAVLGSPLSNEDEISYQLHNSEAKVLLTLASYHEMMRRVCVDTNIQHVIYTDVREYLPVRHRVLLASLMNGGRQAPVEAGAVTPGLHSAASSSSDGNLSEAVASDGGAHLSTAASRPVSAPTVGRPKRSGLGTHEFQQLLRGQPATALDSGTTSESLALLQYTSGTTDNPKGVMLSHGNLMVNVVQVRHWMPDARRGREIILCVLPLSHSYGITDCMNLAMALASSIVLLPTIRTDQVLQAIKQHHPSIFPGVPALYLAIANYPRVRSYGVASIRMCVSGSAPLPVEVQEAFEKLTRGRLVEGYGLTEASPVTHSNPLKGERRVGSIGIPMPGTNARIVDLKTGEVLPPGEVGELLVQGPQVMQGYWKLPEETTQVLRDGWLHTGDLARMDEDGFFTVVDRKKDLILAGPYNVYPRDVEEVLYEHPKVLEAAVVSTPAQVEGQDAAATLPFIKAVVVLKRGEKATPGELLAFCRERLDAYKVPKQIEFRTELPKNFVGKVLRRLLIDA